MANIDVGTSTQVPALKRGSASSRNKGRSRVTNGTQLLPLADGRSTTARRFRDLYQQIAEDLGGLDRMSEGQKQLIRRTAMLSAECERMEALSARGERELDLKEYGRATQFIGITLQRLGITRTMRDVQHRPQDLRSYLAAVEHDPADKDGS